MSGIKNEIFSFSFSRPLHKFTFISSTLDLDDDDDDGVRTKNLSKVWKLIMSLSHFISFFIIMAVKGKQQQTSFFGGSLVVRMKMKINDSVLRTVVGEIIIKNIYIELTCKFRPTMQ